MGDARGTDVPAGELGTDAVVDGRPPIELRMRSTARQVVLEVWDGATNLPRRLRRALVDPTYARLRVRDPSCRVGRSA